jgi:hypothetical protein
VQRARRERPVDGESSAGLKRTRLGLDVGVEARLGEDIRKQVYESVGQGSGLWKKQLANLTYVTWEADTDDRGGKYQRPMYLVFQGG